MPSKIGENTPLANEAFRSEAVAHTEVIRSLAGRTRYLYELISGHVPVSADDQPASPRNPDGELGLNFSGPPWGSAKLVPIAWIGGLKDGGTGIHSGTRPLTSRLDPSGTLVEGVAPGNQYLLNNWKVRSRRYQPFDEAKEERNGTDRIPPYSRGALLLEGYSSTGTCDFAIRVRTDNGPWLEGASSYGVAPSTLVEFSTTSLWVPLNPNGASSVDIEITNTDSTATLHLTSLGIVQRVKRSH